MNINCKGNKNKGGFVESKNCRRDGYEYLFAIAYSPADKKKIVINYNGEGRENIKTHVGFLQRKTKKNKIDINKDEITLNEYFLIRPSKP